MTLNNNNDIESSNGHQHDNNDKPPPRVTSTGLISPFADIISQTNDNDTPNNHSNTPPPDKHNASLPPNTPQVDSYQISHIEQARRRIKLSMEQSPLLTTNSSNGNDGNSSIEYVFPRFDISELSIGKVLGRGGFGTVLEIVDIQLFNGENDNGDTWKNRDGDGGDLLTNFKHKMNNTKTKMKKKKQRSSPRRIKCQSFDAIDLQPPSSSVRNSPNRSRQQSVGRISPRNITRGLRTKAKSWSARRAAATTTGGAQDNEHLEDVSSEVRQFFCRDGVEDVIGEEEMCESGSVDDNGVKEDVVTEVAKSASNEQPQQPSQHIRQISRTFSLKAWRESDPGDEGNDAIPPEEMERYHSEFTKIGASLASCPESTVAIDDESESNVGGYLDECDTDCLVDEVVCPGTDLTNVLEKSEQQQHQPPPFGSAHFGIYDTVHHTEIHDAEDGDQEKPQQQQSQRRRIIFFQPPHQQQQDKQYMSENTTNQSGESQYVIKIIQPTIVQTDFKKFLQAAMDMATETKFLSVLTHPHILQMRAVGQGDMFSPNYFLVLDRLYDTLLDRIEGSWRTLADHLENDFWVWSRTSKVKMLWVERMSVMRDVAGALEYIHSLGIVYRDLKPENIGFDANNVVKLFDFGLAKEVRKEDQSANGTYKLTPNTGSLRYMAPEIGNKWPYNFLADSYSFGIMLWEVSSLNRPFSTYTSTEIRDMVMKWGERPKVKDVWPDRIKELMTNAWDSSFRKRPSMEDFRVVLEIEVAQGLQI